MCDNEGYFYQQQTHFQGINLLDVLYHKSLSWSQVMTTDEGCYSIIDARTFYNVSPQCGPNGQSAPNPAEMEPWSELSTVE